MREETLFTIKTPYREEVAVKGFFFGSGPKTACFVGSLRGNEIQQMYIASQLIKKLGELESKGLLEPDNQFLVIPCVNSFSMNIGKRFWPVDNTDINRMFPGYDLGETTQRIAAAVFEHVKDYKYGIQFASFYLSGDFIPHVRLMHTGYQSPELAKEFGLPFVLFREPTPIDTTTLNYNWQVFETDAYSIYTRETDSIDDNSAKVAIDAVLRFLNALGFIHYRTFGGCESDVIQEKGLVKISAPCGGLFRRLFNPGDEIKKGDVIAVITDPLRGEVKNRIISPSDGIIFFSHKSPTVTEHQLCFYIQER